MKSYCSERPGAHTGRSGPISPQSRVTVGGVGAVVMTNTRVDHHHGSLQQSAGGAVEGDLGRGGVIRRAAAGVGALSAEPELEGLSAEAALVNESDGAW